MSLQELRGSADAPADVAQSAIEVAPDLVIEGPLVRTREWEVGRDPGTARALEQLAGAVSSRRWQFPSVGELEAEFGVEKTRPLLAMLTRQGRVVALDREHYIDSAVLAEFADTLRQVVGELGLAVPAQLREATGLTRKHLIPLLEWADREGLTKREGDARSLVH